MADIEQHRKPNKNKQKEKKMSRKEIEELMDVHKSVYKRQRGAIRRK